MTYRLRPCILSAAALVFIADRITKYIIIKSLVLGQSIKVIPGILHITPVFNDGAAFGVLRGCSVFFIAFSFVVVAAILLILSRPLRIDALRGLTLALILGGAAGNLIDRLKFGYVIDFIDFRIWPAFNVADSAISIGAALIVFSALTKRSG